MGRSGELIRFVPTVKAYPTPSKRHGEAVCVAGIRIDGHHNEWIRLYPVLFRDLPKEQQFHKYDVLELEVVPSTDYRPESVRPVEASIRTVGKLGTKNQWQERREIIEPLLVASMCEVQQRQQQDRLSLAAFRPVHVKNVRYERDESEWSHEQREALSRLSLFAQQRPLLRKSPWRFRYEYSCGNNCRGHAQTIVDWEIHEAYLKWSRKRNETETVKQIRKKWFEELCSPERDAIFFVGNQHLAPTAFLVLGVFWPPKKRPSGQIERLDLGI